MKESSLRIVAGTVALVGLACATYCGVTMQPDELWGPWLALGLMGGTCIVLLALRLLLFKSPEKRGYLLASFGGGIALGFGFVPLPFFPLLMLGFVPLLWVAKRLHTNGHPPRAIWLFACTTLITWNIISSYWVANASLVGGLMAVICNTLLMALPWFGFQVIRRRLSGQLPYLGLLAFWLVFEYLHLRWELSWPWLTLGNGLAGFPQLVQWYEWTGALGGSLWLLGINIIIYKLLQARKNKVLSLRKVVVSCSVLLLPVALSVLLGYMVLPNSQEIEVVAVQPNYEPHYQKFEIPESEQLPKFIALARTQLTLNTRYLALPETSFGIGERDKMAQSPAIQALEELLVDYPNLMIVSGVDAHHFYRPDEKPSPTARLARDGKRRYDTYNAAIQLANFQSEIPFYVKSKLVPGPERIPFPALVGLLGSIIDKWGGAAGSMATQEEREVFFDSTATQAVAPIICYESVYGDYVTGYVRKGATLLFILTNDGWWDNTSGYRQHKHFASLRAIETRRAIVRAANTGTSCFVDAKGNITQETAYETDAAIRGNMAPAHHLTFYVRFGDWLGRLAIGVSLFLSVWALYARWKRK